MKNILNYFNWSHLAQKISNIMHGLKSVNMAIFQKLPGLAMAFIFNYILYFIVFFKYETIVMVFWSFRFRSKQCDIGSLLYWMRSFRNVSMCTVVCASPLAVMRYFMPKWFHKGFSVVMDWHFTHLTKKRRNRYGMKFIFFHLCYLMILTSTMYVLY